MTTESKTHECEPWEMLEHTDGGQYCAACGQRHRNGMMFDPVRGRWYMPDLSDGNLRRLLRAGGEWPISGDKVARTREKPGGLIAIIDWESMEDGNDG